IGGRIVESAVTFLNKAWLWFPFPFFLNEKWIFFRRRRAVRKNAQRSIALPCDPTRRKLIDNGLQAWVVKTFAKLAVKIHAEPAIHHLELDLRKRNHLLPNPQILF